MKRLLTLLLISALAFGCQRNVESDDKLVELAHFNLTAPENWDVIFYTGSEAQLRVPDPNNLDYLILDVRDAEDKIYGEAEPVGSNASTRVYDDACGGAFDCFYLEFEGKTYSIVFSVSSSEQAPENLDGIWFPEVVVETQEMIDLLLTAAPSQG